MKPGLISTPTTQWNVMPHIFEGEWIYFLQHIMLPSFQYIPFFLQCFTFCLFTCPSQRGLQLALDELDNINFYNSLSGRDKFFFFVSVKQHAGGKVKLSALHKVFYLVSKKQPSHFCIPVFQLNMTGLIIFRMNVLTLLSEN